MLVCPSDQVTVNRVVVFDRDWAYSRLTSYGGNGGTRSYFPQQSTADGMFHTTGEASEPKQNQRPVAPRDVTDGLSKTLLFGERSRRLIRTIQTFYNAGWGEPLAEWGWWGASTSRKMIGHVTMSALCRSIIGSLFLTRTDRGRRPPQTVLPRSSVTWTCGLAPLEATIPTAANFAFGDGSLRFLASEIEIEVLRAMSSRAMND